MTDDRECAIAVVALRDAIASRTPEERSRHLDVFINRVAQDIARLLFSRLKIKSQSSQWQADLRAELQGLIFILLCNNLAEIPGKALERAPKITLPYPPPSCDCELWAHPNAYDILILTVFRLCDNWIGNRLRADRPRDPLDPIVPKVDVTHLDEFASTHPFDLDRSLHNNEIIERARAIDPQLEQYAELRLRGHTQTECQQLLGISRYRSDKLEACLRELIRRMAA